MVETVQEKEDRVVREIEVYSSSASSAEEYHLSQYPGHFVNPIPQPPLSVRMKPRHHILEAEHAVHAESYTRVYQSQTIPINTHLCFGRVLVDELSSKEVMHLIPISQISQMRPTFHHLTTNDEDDGEYDDIDRMDLPRDYRTRQESITEDLPPVPSATNITFHRKESDRAVAARKSSYAYQQASQENEPWVSLQVVEQRADLLSPPLSSHEAAFRPLSNYIQKLNYIPTKNSSAASSHPTSIPAFHDALPHPNRHLIAQKLFHVLQSGGPVPLSILLLSVQDPAVHVSSPERSITEVLWEALHVMAVVVRGNWYLHSKYLRPSRNAVSDHALISRLRTFLLLLLKEFGRIDRSSLHRVVDCMKQPLLTSDRILLLLRQVAEPPSSSRRYWVPKMADDRTFVQKYPSIAKLHDAYWKKQRLRFTNEFQLYSDHLLN
jgi:RPC5 protein